MEIKNLLLRIILYPYELSPHLLTQIQLTDLMPLISFDTP